MSYILEALKKSEQERKRGAVPDLQTLHLPLHAEHRSHRGLYAVILLLLLTLAFVLGLLLQSRGESEMLMNGMTAPITENQPPVNTQPPVQQRLPAPAAMQTDAVAKTEATGETGVPVIDHAPEVRAPSLEMDSLPYLADMPALIQQAIPAMTFAGHVYSTNPLQRSVIINGHAMGEGDVVIDNLRVEQITRNGVVFNFDGQLFRMDILQDWSFN